LSAKLPAPDGLAFYAPPAPLAAAPAGRVIWSRQLTGAAALPGAAENLLVLYHSRTLAGQDTAVTGTVSIPPGQPPAGGWPVLSWAHGTTGVADTCAPSRDGPGHPSHIYNQLADAMLNLWVRRGWVVTKTDYEGLGTPGLHPYLVGTSEARGLIDIVLAARQLRRGISTRWGVLGHSQGGHAALFTVSLASAWAPGLDLIGAVALAPAGGAHDMVAGLHDTRTPAPALGFLAFVLIGAAAADQAVRLDQILSPAGQRLLTRVQASGIDDLVVAGSPPVAAAEVLRPGTDLGPLLRVLEANDPAALQPRRPTLIVQGDNDPIVTRSSTDHIVRSLRASGAMLNYHRYPGSGHFDLIAAAHTKTARWIETRLAMMPRRQATDDRGASR
jgi:alpha-beta hydrolase superfamily lysophospholipase